MPSEFTAAAIELDDAFVNPRDVEDLTPLFLDRSSAAVAEQLIGAGVPPAATPAPAWG